LGTECERREKTTKKNSSIDPARKYKRTSNNGNSKFYKQRINSRRPEPEYVGGQQK
jgi:hypothetical protein